ncbi:unnamed protein product [Prorocentrum cordatum]|uniref:Uncharacterized protein n=1 Tax=Prorocentrum cordatum TaxID=2364126 RepID=A0ABN9TE46_9DINO|nr:unnamed protein product [Polarella glacialis]
MVREVWHPEGHLYGIAPDGQSVVDRDAPAFFAGVARRGNSEHLAEHDRIVKIDTAGPRCAVAKVQIALLGDAQEQPSAGERTCSTRTSSCCSGWGAGGGSSARSSLGGSRTGGWSPTCAGVTCRSRR